MRHAIDLRILGPLEVSVDGRLVPLSAAKPRVLLASLLVRPNRIIGVGELAERVWGERPPASVKGALQTYVMRLRQTLGEACVIETVPEGYRLRVAPESLDVLRFTELTERGRAARAADDLLTAASSFTEALDQWRGPALGDIPSEVLQREDAPQLEEQRLRVLEERIDVDLATGRHIELVAELQQLCGRYELREHLLAQLMLALYRSGRQADALEAYAALSATLAEQLGIDPGEELRDIRQGILISDPRLAAPAPAVTVGAGRAEQLIPPSQLPPDLPDFVGREELAARVAELLVAPQPGRGPPIVTLTGPPGIGKTALAVHVAHTVRPHFPGGQLYVNMRGYAPDAPLSAAEVLTRFLRALGVPAEQVPVEQDEQVALYRSRLGDRRVLVLLDNAASAGHVRALLPGGSACAILVTSRDVLRGLAALQGARPVTLDTLDDEESVRLLTAMIGESSTGAEPEATAELAALCTRLPLALRIAAANVAATPTVSIASYVHRLRSGNRLAALVIDGDEQAAVRAAFDISYGALDPAVARAFRLLSAVPGPDFTPVVTGVLCGVSAADGEWLLGVLAAANLVQRYTNDRYQFHDLTREYATVRAKQAESADGSEDELESARSRLFDFYVRNVHQAMRTIIPFNSLLDESTVARVDTLEFEAASEATDWLEAEHANLLAIVDYCLEYGPLPTVWHIVDSFHRYLGTKRCLGDWYRISRAGVQAATYAGDPHAEIVMRISLGLVQMYLGRRQESHAEYLRALAVVRRTPERFRLSGVLINLGLVTKEMGELERSLEYCKDALAAATSEGAVYTRNIALGNLGNLYRILGNLNESVRHNNEALVSAKEFGFAYEEAAKLHNLGESFRDLGEPRKAFEYLERSLSVCGALGVESGEMCVLATLAEVHLVFGHFDSAADCANRALEIAERLRDPSGEADARNALGFGHLRGGRLAEAADCFSRSRSAALESGSLPAELNALVGLTETARALGDLDHAEGLCERAYTRARSAKLGLYEARALTCLAFLRYDRGDIGLAGQTARTALEQHERMGQQLWVARSLKVLGLVHRARGEEALAVGVFGRMRAILITAGVPVSPDWTS